MVANDIDNKKVTSNMRRENEFINVKCFLDACKMEVLDLDYRDTGWQILYKKLKLTNNEIDNHKISRK